LNVVLRITVGAFLVVLSLVSLVGLLTVPEIKDAVMCLATLLGTLWWIWSELPNWLRELARKFFERKERS
jgi:hypothetical protein